MTRARPRRLPRRRKPSTASLRAELEELISQATARAAAAAEQLHAATALRQELEHEHEAAQHLPLLLFVEDGGRVH